MWARGTSSSARSQPLRDAVANPEGAGSALAFLHRASKGNMRYLSSGCTAEAALGPQPQGRYQVRNRAYRTAPTASRGAGVAAGAVNAVNASTASADASPAVVHTDVAIVGGGPGGLAAAAALSRVLDPSVRIKVRRRAERGNGG
mgnify:CR=1 FL=1